jgi:hypothetical protein
MDIVLTALVVIVFVWLGIALSVTLRVPDERSGA